MSEGSDNKSDFCLWENSHQNGKIKKGILHSDSEKHSSGTVGSAIFFTHETTLTFLFERQLLFFAVAICAPKMVR